MQFRKNIFQTKNRRWFNRNCPLNSALLHQATKRTASVERGQSHEKRKAIINESKMQYSIFFHRKKKWKIFLILYEQLKRQSKQKMSSLNSTINNRMRNQAQICGLPKLICCKEIKKKSQIFNFMYFLETKKILNLNIWDLISVSHEFNLEDVS